jgi:Na+-translocating ferredoxin:NAD+ oxidoreductase RnfG subunit
VAIAVLAIAAAQAPPVSGQASTQEEALASAFPGAELERRTAYLDEDQLGRAAAVAGADAELEAAVVTYYVAKRGGQAVGIAYFDAHRVRTLDEVLMIALDPDGRVRRVETVSFREPPEYRAPDGWMRQFDGRALDDDLSLKGEITSITGATLTAGAVTRAVRRTLALHRVIDPLGDGA